MNRWFFEYQQFWTALGYEEFFYKEYNFYYHSITKDKVVTIYCKFYFEL